MILAGPFCLARDNYRYDRQKVVLRTDIQALADISFRKDADKIPIVIKINVLRLSGFKGLNRYIKAEVKVAFYRVKNGKLGKIFAADDWEAKEPE